MFIDLEITYTYWLDPNIFGNLLDSINTISYPEFSKTNTILAFRQIPLRRYLYLPWKPSQDFDDLELLVLRSDLHE